jgi:hypothetical protein
LAEFTSWFSYRTFAEKIRTRNRYIFDDETKQFLDCILATSASHTDTWPADAPLWRAQLHEDNQKIWLANPFTPERMKPLPKCREGRVNPKGIPCLYLAADPDTAMSEVRPWIGAIGTLAKFLPVKDLSLVDCTQRHNAKELLDRSPLIPDEPPPEEREQRVWAHVNAAFSEPITLTDSTADYAPTQVLAEVFRAANFDGIMFDSSLGTGGLNVVLFDLGLADVVLPNKMFRAATLLSTFEPIDSDLPL